MPRSLVASACVALLALLWAGAVALVPAHASTTAQDGTVTWGVRPADDTPHGTDRPNFLYTARPGEVLTDALVVANHSGRELTLQVYAADAFTNSRGVLDVLLADQPSTGIGAWVEIDADELVVPAGESVEVPFTLAVPADAEPGDHAGGIVTSLLSRNEQGVSTDRRLGSRIHLRVDGELSPALAIEQLEVGYAGTANPLDTGRARLDLEVVNVGNARVGGEATVRVTGPFGLATRTEIVGIPELLPGDRVPVTVELTDVPPAFRLRAETTVTGLVAVTGDPIEPVVATASTAAVPWPQLALLVLLVAFVVLWRWRVARREAATARRIEEAVASARGHTPVPLP